MNYRELILQLTPLRGNGEARAIVRMVLEERFGLSQTDLLLGKDTTLSADDRKEFEKIAHRLLSGEPVQYVLGFADFCGHRFRVTPDVLIPRPHSHQPCTGLPRSHRHRHRHQRVGARGGTSKRHRPKSRERGIPTTRHPRSVRQGFRRSPQNLPHSTLPHPVHGGRCCFSFNKFYWG